MLRTILAAFKNILEMMKQMFVVGTVQSGRQFLGVDAVVVLVLFVVVGCWLLLCL